MKQETIDIQAALEAGQKLPFAWVRSLSQVALGRTPLAADLEELLEARFFSRDREIRLFPGEDGPACRGPDGGAGGPRDGRGVSYRKSAVR